MSKKSKSKIQNQEKRVKTHWVSIFVIIGFALAIYAQSVNFNFSYFDDYTILLDNKAFFTTDFSIKKTFTTSAFVKEDLLYRPLQNISFALDAKIAGGINPWSFHLTNVMLFIITGLSLYFLLIKFNITRHFALLGTLLFVANPLNTWSVVWVPARGDLLLTLFTILSFICFINFLKTNRFTDILLTFLCFTFAIFSKETAAIIPFLFLFYFFWKQKPLFSKINYKHFVLASLMLSAGILWYYLRNRAVIQAHEIFSFADVMRNFINIPVALSQIVFPYEMAPFPKFTITKIILGCALLISFFYISFKKNGISKWENLFYFLWFLLFLIPTFYLKISNADYLEHRYLLPQIGILVFIIKQLEIRTEANKSKILRYIIIFFILPIFSITSFVKAQTLRNPDTLLKAAVKYDGFTIIPYLDRGGYFIDLGKYEQAIQDFSKVLQLDLSNYEAIINLAKINMIIKDYESANALYTMALSLKKIDYRIFENRAQAKIELGDLQGALLDIDSAIMLNNNVYLLFSNRGFLKMKLGLYDDVLVDFEEAKRLSNSSNTDILVNCAAVKYQFGDLTGALQDCEMALKKDPNNHDLNALKESILSEISRAAINRGSTVVPSNTP